MPDNHDVTSGPFLIRLDRWILEHQHQLKTKVEWLNGIEAEVEQTRIRYEDARVTNEPDGKLFWAATPNAGFLNKHQQSAEEATVWLKLAVDPVSSGHRLDPPIRALFYAVHRVLRERDQGQHSLRDRYRRSLLLHWLIFYPESDPASVGVNPSPYQICSGDGNLGDPLVIPTPAALFYCYSLPGANIGNGRRSVRRWTESLSGSAGGKGFKDWLAEVTEAWEVLHEEDAGRPVPALEAENRQLNARIGPLLEELREIRRLWKRADAKMMDFVAGGVGVETSGFEQISRDEHQEAAVLVGNIDDKHLLPMLSHVGEQLRGELIELGQLLRKIAQDPRAFWEGAIGEGLDTRIDRIGKLLLACSKAPSVITLPPPRADAPDEADKAEADVAEEQPPSLTRSERRTLCALAIFDSAVLASASDTTDAMDPKERLSDRTVTTAVRRLVELGLAERPQGERQGARLTLLGRRLLPKIAD